MDFFIYLFFGGGVEAHLSVAKSSNDATRARRPDALLPLNNERYDRIRRIHALRGAN